MKSPRPTRPSSSSKSLRRVLLAVLLISAFAGTTNAQPDCRPPLAEQEKELQPRFDELAKQIKEAPLKASLYLQRAGLYRRLAECAGFHTQLGLAYYQKTAEDLSIAIALEPSAETYLLRARCYQRMAWGKKHPEWDQNATVVFFLRFSAFAWAVSDLQEALRLSVNDEQRSEAVGGLAQLHSWRAQTLAAPAAMAELRARGDSYSVWDDFDRAVEYAREMAKHGPKEIGKWPTYLEEGIGGVYGAKGRAAFELGEYDRALAAFKSGEEYLTDHYLDFCTYYAFWGDAYVKKGLLPPAIETFTKALKLSEWNCRYLLERRGDALLAQGHLKEALADYTALFERKERIERCCTGQLSIKRARLYVRLHEPEKAVAEIDRALEKWALPQCPQVYLLRAEAYRLLGNLQRASEDEQKAAKLGSPSFCSEY